MPRESGEYGQEKVDSASDSDDNSENIVQRAYSMMLRSKRRNQRKGVSHLAFMTAETLMGMFGRMNQHLQSMQ